MKFQVISKLNIGLLSDASLTKVLRREGINVLQKQYRAFDTDRPNQKGFPRSHFWNREVARNVVPGEVREDSAEVNINSPALLHKISGGKVTPKRGKALAIPLTAEAAKAGSPGSFRVPAGAKTASAKRRRPGPMDGLTFIPRKGKAPLLATVAADGQITPQYVLLKSVTHQADPSAAPKMETLESALLTRTAAWAFRRKLA